METALERKGWESIRSLGLTYWNLRNDVRSIKGGVGLYQ